LSLAAEEVTLEGTISMIRFDERLPNRAVHGGDLEETAKAYGVAPHDLLDFSVSINPRGLPAGARAQLARDSSDVAELAKYPDRSANKLRQALSELHQISRESIIVGAGAEALILSMLQTLRPTQCLVPVPAFSEYARALAAIGSESQHFCLRSDRGFELDANGFCAQLLATRPDLTIINNPHNPSGSLVSRENMGKVIGAAKASGTMILVDEAFMDYCPDQSLIQTASCTPGLIVVRSLTKFYGCPALRVGYAVASPYWAARLSAGSPTWPVTTLALNALSIAVEDEEYRRDTLRECDAQRRDLRMKLGAIGATVYPSVVNFLLIRLPDGWPPASDLRDHLIRESKIVVRNCDSYDNLETGHYIRVAVRGAGDNSRLVDAMVGIKGPLSQPRATIS
jgi:threonine-phosphate decarboxylase